MADDKNIVAKETENDADEQRAIQLENDKADAANNLQNAAQRSAAKAYAAVSSNQ